MNIKNFVKGFCIKKRSLFGGFLMRKLINILTSNNPRQEKVLLFVFYYIYAFLLNSKTCAFFRKHLAINVTLFELDIYL